jgi:molecular chaperone DnaK
VEPSSFAIRHGLTLSEPPLPHSIGAEIARPDGDAEMDVIFPRSTPLPAEKVVTYKASRTLRPALLDEVIAIKLWEGESSDPESNNFVGALRIRSEEIRRPIREGADIELTISIDTSRRMEVHAFVPSIAQHFQEKVYVAQDNDPNLLARAEALDEDILMCREKLRDLENLSRTTGKLDIGTQIRELNMQVDDLWLAFDEFRSSGLCDPDDARKLYQRYTGIRGRISYFNRKLSASTPFERALAKLREERSEAMLAAADYGTPFDRKEVDQLCNEAEEHINRQDADALDRMAREFRRLRVRIYVSRDEFWIDWFHALSGPYRTFNDRNEAERYLAQGRQALQAGDQGRLRDSVRGLWRLMPDTEEQEEEKRGMDAGIRRAMRRGEGG